MGTVNNTRPIINKNNKSEKIQVWFCKARIKNKIYY